MTFELKARKIGKAVGFILPKEVLARRNSESDDSVLLTKLADSAFRLTVNNPAFDCKMAAAKSLSQRYRHALKGLTK